MGSQSPRKGHKSQKKNKIFLEFFKKFENIYKMGTLPPHQNSTIFSLWELRSSKAIVYVIKCKTDINPQVYTN